VEGGLYVRLGIAMRCRIEQDHTRNAAHLNPMRRVLGRTRFKAASHCDAEAATSAALQGCTWDSAGDESRNPGMRVGFAATGTASREFRNAQGR
jgi:hypothetical protein